MPRPNIGQMIGEEAHTLNIYLKESQYSELVKIALEHKQSVSSLIRDIIDMHIEGYR